MTDSRNGARIAVLCDNNNVPYEEIACLYENQIEFNYLPAALLEQAAVKNGKVCIQGYAYECVLNLLGQAYEERFAVKLGKLLLTKEDMTEFKSDVMPDLRVIRLQKNGVNMVLFGNEGSGEINTQIAVPGMKHPLFVDLWKGSLYTVEGAGKDFPLNLSPSETVLVVDWKPEPANNRELTIEHRDRHWFMEEYPDWSDRFTLKERKENRADYVLKFHCSDTTKPVKFSVSGEEMVECYCNNRFVDVTFFGDRRYDISGFLREGDNEIRLVVTGNAANIYEHAKIPFGIFT